METNETFDQQGAQPGIILTFEAQGYLHEAGKWAYFLSIIGFIGCALLLIAAFFAGSMFSKMAEFSPTSNPVASIMAGMGGFITALYILIDLLYFFFVLYLYQFGSRIKKGVLFSDSIEVTGALQKLKSFFKLWGITTIVVISLYVLIFVLAILVGTSLGHV
jgi:hypothetical protein